MLKDKEITRIIEEYGSPIYIYDKNVCMEQYNRLKAALLPNSNLYYAFKANPLSGIGSIFAEQGAGVEVASIGELQEALTFLEPDRIYFTSPGKTRRELEFAIDSNIKLINVESVREAEIINELAVKAGKRVDIGIRINPAVSFSNAKIKMSGVASQFGIEEQDCRNPDGAITAIKKLDNIRITGFQVYMGTQMCNYEDICQNTEYVIRMSLELSEVFGIELRYLNLGGGFGVRYFKNEEQLDTDKLKESMRYIYDNYREALSNVEIIFESGRFLTAEAGVMVTRVLYTKESKGSFFVICDGGSNIHSSAAFLGRFVRNNFPFRIIKNHNGKNNEDKIMEMNPGKSRIGNICGPLCTSLDIIAQKVELPEDITEGDLVVIEKSGAYGLTYSPTGFLSHELPAEALYDNGRVQRLR